MNKRTLGAWKAECYGSGGDYSNPVDLYEVTADDHVRVCESALEADARLIAAAPDLLEACKLALERGDLFNADADRVRAAIAKAEGK